MEEKRFRFYGELKGHRDCLYALSEGIKEGSFLSSGGDGLIAEWNPLESQDAKLLVQVPASVYALCLDKSKAWLWVGTRSGQLHLVDLHERREIRVFQWDHQPIYALAIDEDGNLWVGSASGTVRRMLLTEATSTPSLLSLTVSQAAVRCLQWDKEKQLLYVGSSDSHIRLIQSNGQIAKTWAANSPSVFSIATHPFRSEILSGGRDARLWSIDQQTGASMHEPIKAHWYTINHLLFSPDGQFLASASRDKSIRIWDSETLTLNQSLALPHYPGHTHSVNRLLWLGNTLISAGDDKTLRVWTNL